MPVNAQSLVDPELLGFLDALPVRTLDAMTLPAFRQAVRVAPPFFTLPAAEVVSESGHAPGRAGAPDVPIFTFRPAAPATGPWPCILHIHGGGYVQGASSGLAPRHMATGGCDHLPVQHDDAADRRQGGIVPRFSGDSKRAAHEGLVIRVGHFAVLRSVALSPIPSNASPFRRERIDAWFRSPFRFSP